MNNMSLTTDEGREPVGTLLTVSETQRRLKLSESAVRKLLGRGALPFVKIGASVRIRASDLAAFLAARTIPARQPQ